MHKLTFSAASKLKVVAINGSHRKGNTQFLVQTLVNQINQNPSQNEAIMINLRDRNIEYSSAQDYECKSTHNCTCCRDDMRHIYPLLQSADMIVFGSPIYFYSVSGRMKTFMDRCNGYIWNKKLSSKQAFIVGVGGSTNQTEMVNSLRSYFKALGLIHAGEYFARAQKASDLQNNEKLIAQFKKMVNTNFLDQTERSKAANLV